MQGGRDPFGNPLGGPFGNAFGGFPNQRSLMSSFFGDRDPFDDLFFRNPFGGMLGPSLFDQNGSGFGPRMFGPNGGPFESSLFGQSPFMNMETPGFIEHQPSQRPRSTGPIIEELNSDDENEEKEGKSDSKDPKKHRISRDEPFIEIPDDETGERSNQMQVRNDFNRVSGSSSRAQALPQTRSFTFQSSSVTYGGANGQYYTSSTTKRSGSDGLVFEEHKEADSATRQAAHRISKGLNKKGHSVTRKLNSDGRVQTTQTLHNLNPDEVSGFEETWKGNAAKQLPGWNSSMNAQGAIGSGSGSNGPYPPNGGRGWAALPAAGGGGSSQSVSGMNAEPGASHPQSHPHPIRTKPDVGKRKGSSSAGMGPRMTDK